MIGKVISFQVRDQEDEEQREARLATDRDHHALVRDLFTVHSQALVRQYNKRHHHLAHHPRSKLLLLGLVKSVSGARSRRCRAESRPPCHR